MNWKPCGGYNPNPDKPDRKANIFTTDNPTDWHGLKTKNKNLIKLCETLSSKEKLNEYIISEELRRKNAK